MNVEIKQSKESDTITEKKISLRSFYDKLYGSKKILNMLLGSRKMSLRKESFRFNQKNLQLLLEMTIDLRHIIYSYLSIM